MLGSRGGFQGLGFALLLLRLGGLGQGKVESSEGH